MTDKTSDSATNGSNHPTPVRRARPKHQDPAENERPQVALRFVNIALAVALLILTWQWLKLSLQRPQPLPWQHSAQFDDQFRVDINRATWVEWIQLQGIGEVMAHRIVVDRETNGPFHSLEDLQRVHGIGPGTLDRIRPRLTISHDISIDSTVSADQRPQQPRSF